MTVVIVIIRFKLLQPNLEQQRIVSTSKGNIAIIMRRDLFCLRKYKHI